MYLSAASGDTVIHQNLPPAGGAIRNNKLGSVAELYDVPQLFFRLTDLSNC